MTMTTTAQAVAFAPQPGNAPGNDSASALVSVTDESYRWLTTSNISLATAQDQKPLPLEMAGSLLPRAVYKGGAFVGGTIALIPRVSGSHLHWLLFSLTSSWAHKADGTKHDHYYGTGDDPVATWDPSSETTKAATGGGANDTDYFLSAKRLFPKPDSASSITTRSGETYEDLRASNLRITFAPAAPVAFEFGLVGRKSALVKNTSAGAATYWDPKYKDTALGFPGLPDNSSFLLGCKGEMKMPAGGTDLNLSSTGAEINIAALLTSPQDEQIMFSYHPETFRVLARNVTVSIRIKRNVLAMYSNIYANGGEEWSPTVWKNGAPLSIVAESPDDAEFGTFPGQLEFWAKDIEWSMAPLLSDAGKILGGVITGTVTEPEGNTAAWYLRIRNDRDPDIDENGDASVGFYNWPTP